MPSLGGGKNPVRIICDTNLRLPVGSRIAQTARDVRTIIATACVDRQKQSPLLDAGCEIINVPVSEDHIDLKSLTHIIGGAGIDSVLLEGGGSLNFSALKSGIVNKVQIYVAPKIFGGASAKTPVGGDGFLEIADCVQLKRQSVAFYGEDIFIECGVENSCSQG
jgi:diaminohydroxyphosphoribosylaminopyrimidine deaminase/5-amino-6-(5-phosphoribosylamino)uracil reductase